jgi:uncharacterized glyoxalase superfamily metalloenzyme YdcJ
VSFIEPWQLRARFARSLAEMYGREVPAYTTLVDVSREVNEAVVEARGADAERLGSLDRVTAERHGAIRLGTPRVLAQVARIFGAMGMFPVGFYDLRDAAPSPVPVVSTAFRPIDASELARNPFRVFTSLLAVSDRRFFTAELQRRLEQFLDERVLFPPELLTLTDRAETAHGLHAADADRFIELATQSFELSHEPVDEDWYRELERISAVAADIGGVASTHINHLTPRVLDIDELYARMQARGIEMIDAIQGPPRWDGPDVLLRQTSFRALAEPRAFRRADGSVHQSSLRVRFGEVEARGIALTAAGRALYDELTAERADARQWYERFPTTERELASDGLAFFTYELVEGRRRDDLPPTEVAGLIDGGWVTARPIVYEDFLPRSAAGIFQSNLIDSGSHDTAERGADLDAGWMAGVLGRELADPISLYAAQSEQSLDAVRRALTADAHLSRS